MRPAHLALLAAAVASALFVVALVLRRTWVAHEQRRHDDLVTRLRPASVAFVEGELEAAPPQIRGLEAQVFAELLADYARLLRGEPRDRIAAYFERTGAAEEQIRHLRALRTWRRASAAFALGDMGSERAVAPLSRALDDRARDVRMAAARSLGRLGAVAAIEPLVTAGVSRKVPRNVVSLALFDIGPTAVPNLLPLIARPEPEVRAAAIELVGLVGDPGDAEPLLPCVSDTAASVRAAAAAALGRVGAARARDALIDALADRVPDVRTAAARALGQLGGRQATEALLELAKTDAFDPAREAADALARIDPSLVIRVAAQPGAGPHLREAADLAAL